MIGWMTIRDYYWSNVAYDIYQENEELCGCICIKQKTAKWSLRKSLESSICGVIIMKVRLGCKAVLNI